MDVHGLREHSTTLVLVTGLLFTIYLFGRRTFSYFKKLNIPGPEPASHLGNLKEIRQKGYNSVFKYWREVYGDVYGIYLGANPVLVISDPEMIQEVFVKKFQNFINRTTYARDEINKLELASAKDDHWKYLRNVMAPSYSPRQIRETIPMIHTCAETLVENTRKLADSESAENVNSLFSAYTMDVMATTGFGMQVDSLKNPNDPLVTKAKDIFKGSMFNPSVILTLLFPPAKKLMEIFGLSKHILGNQIYYRKFCRQLIEEQKRSGIKDDMPKNVLNLMIKAQLKEQGNRLKEEEKENHLKNVTGSRTGQGITDNEILAQCVIFFLAGYETTTSSLNFFTHLMAINPEPQQKIYEEIVDVLGEDLPNYDNVKQLTYLDMCMDESLRMYPLGTGLDRKCNKACVIKGVEIPEKLTLRIAVDALHYNPKYWPEPEKFIPERFSKESKLQQVPFTYLPFGAGPRMCLGIRLAKLVLKIAAVQMIRNFKILPTEKTEDPLILDDTFKLAAKNGVWVKFQQR